MVRIVITAGENHAEDLCLKKNQQGEHDMSDNSNAVPVEAPDSAKKTSEILGPMSEEATVEMDLQNEKCYWNDVEFSQGDQVIADGKCYECSYTRWLEVDD